MRGVNLSAGKTEPAAAAEAAAAVAVTGSGGGSAKTTAATRGAEVQVIRLGPRAGQVIYHNSGGFKGTYNSSSAISSHPAAIGMDESKSLYYHQHQNQHHHNNHNHHHHHRRHHCSGKSKQRRSSKESKQQEPINLSRVEQCHHQLVNIDDGAPVASKHHQVNLQLDLATMSKQLQLQRHHNYTGGTEATLLHHQRHYQHHQQEQQQQLELQLQQFSQYHHHHHHHHHHQQQSATTAGAIAGGLVALEAHRRSQQLAALQFANLHGLSAVLEHRQEQQQHRLHNNNNINSSPSVASSANNNNHQLPDQANRIITAAAVAAAAVAAAANTTTAAATASAQSATTQGAARVSAAAQGGGSQSMKRPSSLGPNRRAKVRKCRKTYGIERRNSWCTQCKWKKACSRFCDLRHLDQQLTCQLLLASSAPDQRERLEQLNQRHQLNGLQRF